MNELKQRILTENEEDLNEIENQLAENLKPYLDLVSEVAHHILFAGGKRLRPMLTLAAARMCGYEGDHHIKLAATVEFIHTATLLHDDVVEDEDAWTLHQHAHQGDHLADAHREAVAALAHLGRLDEARRVALTLPEGHPDRELTLARLDLRRLPPGGSGALAGLGPRPRHAGGLVRQRARRLRRRRAGARAHPRRRPRRVSVRLLRLLRVLLLLEHAGDGVGGLGRLVEADVLAGRWRRATDHIVGGGHRGEGGRGRVAG